MFIVFHQLPLPLMFVVVLLISLTICWLIIGAVRTAARFAGYDPTEMLPIRDSIIGACTTIFALIIAFSAAGIWNDALNARNTVQREADALENVAVLTAGLPADVQSTIRNDIRAYASSVITIDWPEMAKGGTIDNPVFDQSEKILIGMIELLSSKQASLAQLATFTPLLNQLLEVRHARLARLAAADAGISWAQWIAMFIISTVALTAIAICNTHSRRMQVTATHLYVLVASAAYFVILAHDRPFIGTVSVKPLAFQSLIKP
ncbi:hypothetical protein [Bradyrhizobium prioriisuperbiae]|uniref:bestrophin-like domain n=1 Tax=Bradyrhizobium prioriisuperbiae TaxID=2854389 RepID=UPI0028E9F5E7|nr:hypothetical protein [Bradyrhizobium prioritasuperba]